MQFNYIYNYSGIPHNIFIHDIIQQNAKSKVKICKKISQCQ